jgi:hypothetical protein
LQKLIILFVGKFRLTYLTREEITKPSRPAPRHMA